MKELRPKVLSESVDICPVCGRRALKVIEALHEIPLAGRILIVTLKCGGCGYKHVSIMNVEQSEPMRLSVRVERPEDLNIKVVRSGTATVRIPELGITIEPGPLAQGEITTIEGYLLRVAELVESLYGDSEEGRRVLSMLERARRGELPFTFILEDPLGNSMLIAEAPGKVKAERLSDEDLKRLKYGDVILEMRGARHGEEAKEEA